MNTLRGIFVAAAMLAAATLLVACGGAAVPVATQPAGSILLTANLSTFAPTSVSAAADQAFTIWFDNKEVVAHNVRVTDAAGTTVGPVLELFTGPAARPLDVPPLAAGTYSLLCDVHPEMRAELIAAN